MGGYFELARLDPHWDLGFFHPEKPNLLGPNGPRLWTFPWRESFEPQGVLVLPPFGSLVVEGVPGLHFAFWW